MHVSGSTNRLLALWNHLGISQAHVAAQMPGDVISLAERAPERIGHLVLCTPSRLDPAPFTTLAERIVMIAGESGLTAQVTARGADRLAGAQRILLAAYAPP